MSNDLFLHKNIGAENIGSVLLKVEELFSIRVDITELKGIKTFGDLCDVIYQKIKQRQESCTSQHAFYILRNAIISLTGIQRNEVTLQTCLKDVASDDEALDIIVAVEDELGIRCNIARQKAINNLMQLVKRTGADKRAISSLATKPLGRLAEKIARKYQQTNKHPTAPLSRDEIAYKLLEHLNPEF